ncbi:MAG: hypothetical protein AAGM67_12530, partial [Bacteroidota bacterium]
MLSRPLGFSKASTCLFSSSSSDQNSREAHGWRFHDSLDVVEKRKHTACCRGKAQGVAIAPYVVEPGQVGKLQFEAWTEYDDEMHTIAMLGVGVMTDAQDFEFVNIWKRAPLYPKSPGIVKYAFRRDTFATLTPLQKAARLEEIYRTKEIPPARFETHQTLRVNHQNGEVENLGEVPTVSFIE